MTTRNSTDVLSRQGARKTTVLSQDKFVNVFKNTLGFDKAVDAANIALSDRTLLSTSAINSEQFYVAKSFFKRRGASEEIAISMALIMLDVAKISGVSVMKVLEPFSENPDILLDFTTFATLNVLRPTSSKQGMLNKNDNSKSYRRRNILS